MKIPAAPASLVALAALLPLSACAGEPSPPAEYPPMELAAADAPAAEPAPAPDDGQPGQPGQPAREVPSGPDAPPAGPAPMSLEAPADVAAAPADAEVTPSGLASKVLLAGSGTEHPTVSSRVTVHYTGWTTDGKRFDSSVARGTPATFPLDGVIAGWTEGVQLMVVGERRRFWIPGALAYDNSSHAGTPKGTLVFDVELLSIE